MVIYILIHLVALLSCIVFHNKENMSSIDLKNMKSFFKTNLRYITIVAFLFAAFLIAGKLKSGYHMDEFFTFGLSNHQFSSTHRIGLNIEDGMHYNGEEFWDEYLTVSEGGRFDYANVWENQEHDVHPPLFYVLIHTVSSIFPDMSIKRIGLLVNIPLALLAFLQYTRLLAGLNINDKSATALAAFFVLSYGFVDFAIVFFRMYTLLAIWMNALILLFLKYRPDCEGKFLYYFLLGTVLLGGILTQYYFLIFAFFACLLYAVYVILAKKWKKLILSVITVIFSIILSFLIFPGIKHHIFESYRGKEAFANASSAGFLDNLWRYLNLINMDIFGGLFTVLLAIALCLAIILTQKNHLILSLYPYMILIVPVCLYVLVIAKISPYLTMRYCISNMGLLYVGLLGLLLNMATRISERAGRYILFLAVIMLFSGYRKMPSNMYVEEKNNVATAKENADIPCVYLYTYTWKIPPNLQEIRQFNDIVFINADHWDNEKGDFAQYESIVVFLDNEKKPLLDQIKEHTGLEDSQVLYKFGYTTTYILSQK